VPRPSLIQQYVDNSVTHDKSTAGLAVLNNQKQNYLNEIDELAPLGSTLKQLDRQADINEKEYLAILNGLHLARLRQSNLSLSSNIAVQDKPFFPLQAQPSTRGLLIALSFFVGFILVAAFAIGKEFLDSSIRSPERANKIIGLPVAGAFITNTGQLLPYQLPVGQLLAEKLISTILPYLSKAIGGRQNAQLTLVSTKAGVYQKKDIVLLQTALLSIFDNAYWVVPSYYADIFSAALSHDMFGVYTPGIAQLAYKNVQELVTVNLKEKGLIVYVSPNLSQSSMPQAIAASSDMALLAFNATDTWLPMDKEIVQKTKAAVNDTPLFTWLVNTDETNLDGIIGEVPKQRSWLRKKIKKIITLNLK
jgi:hypothetical protein